MKSYNILITAHDNENGDQLLVADTYSIKKAISELQKLEESSWTDELHFKPDNSVLLEKVEEQIQEELNALADNE